MLLPVVLSGGSGDRLWPLSRGVYPKQFLNLVGVQSLFQTTIHRVIELPDTLKPTIVCNQKHRFIVAEQLQQINVDASGIILEPGRRNTAPAITAAALQALHDGEDPVLLILPSDHLISETDIFYSTIRKALPYAESGKLVTFGIKPTKPETGYGYVKTGQNLGVEEVYLLDQFVEKPDIDRARVYLDSGDYYWNSGMFMFRASRILEEIDKYQPEILQTCTEAFEHRLIESDFITLEDTSFRNCPGISIDYAVMEKTSDAVILPMNICWTDIGSWEAVYHIGSKDQNGNVKLGNVLAEKSTNSYLRADHHLLAVIGMDDVVVIETDNAILVMRKDQSQEIRKIVDQLT